MCGRYFFNENIDLKPYIKRMKKEYEQIPLDLITVNDIYPGNTALTQVNDGYDIMKWNYSLFSRNMINTRLESINEKHYYDFDFANHKCLVLASGFYEWNEKTKYAITTKNNIIYLAAIYQLTDKLSQFSIITRPAIQTASIHHRAPIVLDENAALAYLNNELSYDYLSTNEPKFKISSNTENLTLF